ncbi:MAG: PRD domain-containing protein [Lactimicrobium sp.]|uniref:PRD domain-containing protein n=1 Tax=Lactimicrobium sp. TaxID=2563780 RepID=UPI002F35C2A5
MKRKQEEIYTYVQQTILADRSNRLTTEQIAAAMHMQRSNVSSALNDLVKEGRLVKSKQRPVIYGLPTENQNSDASDFDNLIGADTVFAKPIAEAQAYLLYPNRSGVVLLISPDETVGLGFARRMYQFACQKQVFSKGTSCQILDVTFLGRTAHQLEDAVKDKTGMVLVERASLLPNQELARLIADETDRKERIWIISLSVFAGDFGKAQRIELPGLSAFGIRERLQIGEEMLSEEVKQAGCDLDISREAFLSFVLFEEKAGLQTLQNEMRAACAMAYRRIADDAHPQMHVVLDDLSTSVREYAVSARGKMRQLNALISSDVLQFDHEKGFLSFDALQKDMLAVVRQEDEKCPAADNENVTDTGELAKVVDPRLIQIVSVWLEKTRETLQHSFPPQIFYGICLHLNAFASRPFKPVVLSDEKMHDIVENHPKEYQCAFSLARELYDALGLELNTGEIAVLSEYLLTQKTENHHPVFLYAFHGSGAARALADATNALTHLNNAYGFDMDLDTDPVKAEQDLEEMVKSFDHDAGIVAMYDMGSFQTMLENISARTHIPIRSIYMPVTLWGLDLARMCAKETGADDVYHSFMLENRELKSDPEKKQPVIVTLCQTGEGGAMELKRYIDQYSHLGIPTVAMSIDNREQLARRMDMLRRTSRIHAFVGTFNPHMFGIPFIPVSRIFANPKEVLDQVLTFAPVRTSGKNYNQVYEFLQGEFHYTSIPRLKELLPGVVDALRRDYGLNDQQEDGIFIHIACAIERILAGKPAPSVEKSQKEKVWRACRDDLNNVARIVRRLEKGFHMVFADDDLVTLVIMLKRI